MPFVGANPSLRQLDDRNWELLEDLEYFGQSERFVVPGRRYDVVWLRDEPGFTTDFASVPRPLVWLIPVFGSYTRAAILHDWLCVDLAKTYTGRGEGGRFGVPLASARDTDGLFRRVLREEEVGFIQRWLMWTGVRWAALLNPARRTGWWRDLPAMVPFTLLALVLVGLPAVIVSLFLGLYMVLEMIATVVKPNEKPTAGVGVKT